MSLLEMEGVRGGYGDVDILNGVDLRIEPGEVVVVVGPNGAGKSTAMKAIFGIVRVRTGEVRFRGEDITGLAPDRIVRKGICYAPQTGNTFPSLSVEENLEMGGYVLEGDLRPRMERVYALFPALREKRRAPVRTLSGGQAQMVAIGRALMVEPSLLLLDEPTAGLSPRFMNQIFEIVRGINAEGVAVLMVEQNARQALAMADRGYVLVQGENRFEGTGPELLANREVAETFLGG
jgi:branched-chain amino acid transport system ATP-binding protein